MRFLYVTVSAAAAVLLGCGANATAAQAPGAPAAPSTEPYAFPAWETATEATDLARYSTREEYERAVADARFALYTVRYPSDGLEVVAYAYLPRAAGPPLPTIVFNRGSWVRGDVAPELLPTFHRLALEGFAVVAPMYRGSAGAEGRDEMGGADLADLMNVAGVVGGLPRADTDRLFLYGESRGGMMVLQAIRDRFPARAAATFGAFTDLGRMLDDPRWAAAAEQIWPDFAERREEIVERRSALAWADRLRVPLLLMHGGDDESVDPSHALDLARRLHALDRPFGLIVFAGDDHVLTENRLERDRQAAAFFRSRLGER